MRVLRHQVLRYANNMRALGLILFATVLLAAVIRKFDPTPLESVSETTANASIGDLNGDGFPDIASPIVPARRKSVSTTVTRSSSASRSRL